MDQLNGKHIAGMGQSQPAQIEPGMPPAWNSYIFVEDSRATSAQCEALGAKVLAGPMDVSEYGVLAALSDPNGALFSMWPPQDYSGLQVMQGGAYKWVEIYANNPEKDAEYYKVVLGRSLGKGYKLRRCWLLQI